MRVICCVCDILYNLKEPFSNDDVSHGYCEECWPWVENNLRIEMESRTISQASRPNLNLHESGPTGIGHGGARQPKGA
jgi:hypothetical protein